MVMPILYDQDADYTNDGRWNWGPNNPEQHCKHSTFIGSWWGPDILCHWCESGEDPE